MKNTNLKQFLDMKEKEFDELQALYEKASVAKTTVVYQKYSYTARALEGQLKRVQNQIRGALNIMEKINSTEWVLDHLIFMEKLAEEEFSCHIVVDSKFYSVKLDVIIDKVIEEMGVSDNTSAVNRLKGIKSNIVVNLKRYADYDYRLDWIRDRYFEIAAFIDFKTGKTVFEYSDTNTIYDIAMFGEKSMHELSKAGLFFNVVQVKYDVLKDATAKEMVYLKHKKV